LHDAADEQPGHDAEPRDDHAAAGDPGKRRGNAEYLGDVGDLDLGEAELLIERTGHEAGHRLAELVEHDEGEDDEGAAARPQEGGAARGEGAAPIRRAAAALDEIAEGPHE